MPRSPQTPKPQADGPGLRDRLQRPLTDLRISVTDRCNFRCVYCMPKEIFGPGYRFLSRPEVLTFEEITRLARLFVALGVRKLRLTGGEPLLRRDLERLVGQLAEIPGIEDLALTTNGSLLTRDKARQLRAAGLRRMTISLDALDDQVFAAINEVGFPAQRVLEAIDHAAQAGFAPIKINMVVKRGLNDHHIVEMARYFRGSGHVLRFIEYMDVGNSNGWRLEDVVPAREILARIAAQWPVEALEPTHYGEVARRYRYVDGQGEIGIIASVSQPFCRTCTRARLSADGQFLTCLFAERGYDLRRLLRSGADDAELSEAIRAIWEGRSDRYSELRTAGTPALTRHKVEMFHIGG